METKKQNLQEPKETSAAASRMAAARKQSDDEASAALNKGTAAAASKMAAARKQSDDQGSASMSKGPSANEGASLNQGTTRQNNAGEQDLLQHAKQATGVIVDQVQQRAGSQLTRQKESTATDLSQVVDAVRRFGQGLGGEDSGPIARYAAEYGDKAANSLERLSTYIREQDPKQVLHDVQNFGRRRPALLLGGAFLLGFAGARLIKSSMDTGSQQSFAPNASAARPSPSPNSL